MGTPANPLAGGPLTVQHLLAGLTFNDRLTPNVARALLGHVIGASSTALLTHPERAISPEHAAAFQGLAARAAAGEPLPYLTGTQEFYGLRFEVTPDVLIPRPETEKLVEAVLAWAAARPGPLHISDVGTGSGIIPVTLAARLPEARFTAVDISAPALEVAQRNAKRHAVAGRIAFAQGDLLSEQPGPFDAITANLPYVGIEELSGLEVARWEPHIALSDQADGLSLIRRLITQAAAGRLKPGGLLALEVGSTQGEAVLRLCRAAFPAAHAELLPDDASLDRAVLVHL